MIYTGDRVAPRMMGMAVSPWSPRLRLDCLPEVFSGETLERFWPCLASAWSFLYIVYPELTSTSFPVFNSKLGMQVGASAGLSWLTPQTTRRAWCASGGSWQLKQAICGLHLCMSAVLTCTAETWVSWSLGCCSSPLHSIFYTSIERVFFLNKSKSVCPILSLKAFNDFLILWI